MRNSTTFPLIPRAANALAPGWAWSAALTDAMLQTQRIQLKAIAQWQGSFVALQSELWDEWRCRFAGGVPLDG
jgi:hypothetical protein